jgi:hypothetical protein
MQLPLSLPVGLIMKLDTFVVWVRYAVLTIRTHGGVALLIILVVLQTAAVPLVKSVVRVLVVVFLALIKRVLLDHQQVQCDLFQQGKKCKLRQGEMRVRRS